MLLTKSSPYVVILLAVGLLTIAAIALSGCDLATQSSADPLATPSQAVAGDTATPVIAQSQQATATVEQADPPSEVSATIPPTDMPLVPTNSAAPTDTPAPPTDTPAPPPTDTPQPPTKTPRPGPTRTTRPTSTDTPEPEVASPTEEAASENISTPDTSSGAADDATAQPEATSSSGKMVSGQWYDAYVPAATKTHQYYHFTCEFDAAWVVLKTNGIDVTLADQLAITGQDTSIEPRYEETADGIFIYGGDILHFYSGDYTSNFLARTTGAVMARVFEHYGLNVTPVHTQDAMEAALRQNRLVWIKTTADFKPGRPATWVMPDGTTYETVLGNDHAAVVMGYSERGALIRDVLGPTSTNENRQYEYEVPWPKFMAAWDQQQDDGLAVGK